MCLEEICRTVRIQVLDLSTYLWEEDRPPIGKDVLAEIESNCQRLEAEIKRRINLAARYWTNVVELRRRLARYETDSAQLLRRAKVYHRLGDRSNAWNHSLQLEQLRQVIHHERNRLKTQEEVYHSQLTHANRLKHRLASLRKSAPL